MNANKLIAELEERNLQGCIYQEAATMLRTQQAEIEALKHWQDTWRPFLKQHFGIDK
jgi:uncharacterized protein (DUF305 family)